MQAQDVAHRAVRGQGAYQRGSHHVVAREDFMRKLPGSGRVLQRSCFRVRLADLVAASVDVPAAAPASNGIHHVIGAHRVVPSAPHGRQPGGQGLGARTTLLAGAFQ
jgi:hypothetical protein